MTRTSTANRICFALSTTTDIALTKKIKMYKPAQGAQVVNQITGFRVSHYGGARGASPPS